MTTTRAARREVRNPVLGLPSAKLLATLPPQQQIILRVILLELAGDARARAEQSWKKHKAPMAAYWKAVAVYAKHIANVMREQA